jgi:hypothetical protein
MTRRHFPTTSPWGGHAALGAFQGNQAGLVLGGTRPTFRRAWVFRRSGALFNPRGGAMS